MKSPIRFRLLSALLFITTSNFLFAKNGGELDRNTAPQCLLTANATVAGIITCTNPTTTITATAANGTPPYTFAWSNGNTGQTISVADCGSYIVTATDANNCTAVKTATVNCNNTPPLAVATSVGTITCVDLTAELFGTGSATGAGISYIWTGPCIDGPTNGLNATACSGGTYFLQVTNAANGCTNTAETTVDTDVNPPTVVIAPPGQLNCTTTTIQLDGTGSSSGANFQINWTVSNGGNIVSGATTLLPTINAPGTYTLTLTNLTNGCTASASRNVSQNIAAPTAEAGSDSLLNCTITQLVLNGNGSSQGTDFQYLWMATNGGNIVSGATTLTPLVNAAGIYNLVVTNTQNGCTASDFATVASDFMQPTAGAANGGPLTCTNLSTLISATSSAANSAFLWSGPGGFSSNNQSEIVATVGLYSVVVTDLANGCSASASTLVTENVALPTAAATVSGPLDCINTTIQIDGTASSQGPDFNYLWTTADGNIVSGATTLTPVVNVAGTYNLLVSNSLNGCTATATAVVLQTPAVAATIISTQNVACNGDSNGSATVAASGGTGNFSLLWSNGETTATIQNLAAGSYSVVVTDANSCTATATATISQPEILNANATATPVSGLGQNDGTASANPTGGIPNAFGSYLFSWSNGDTTATITGLAPGNYSIEITDANGCTTSQTVTVNAFNCIISAVISSENLICNTENGGQPIGSATANLTGGTAPFSYLWSNGETTAGIDSLPPGNYSVEITDANGCPASSSVTISEPPVLLANATATPLTMNGANDGTASASPTGGSPGYQFLWSNGETTTTITGLAPGNFTVSITDANGCMTAQSVTVNAFNCTLSASVSSQQILCFGDETGSATAFVNGAAQPVGYLWSNGATTFSIENLPAGVYSVEILDANGCPASLTATISQPDELVVATSFTPPTTLGGNDGTATASPSGGVPGYQFLWSNGETTATIAGLAPGTYTVSVTDANGCLEVRSVEVGGMKCAVSMQFTAVIDVSCFGLADGAASAEMIGGQAPFQFHWSNGEMTASISNLISGNYSVSILDSQGCPTSGTVFIDQPDELKAGLSDVQNVICPDGNDGTATAAATGGTTPFTFAWSNGQASPTATGLPVGPFSVVVTDENGCSTAVTGAIISTDNEPPTLVCPPNSTACPNANVVFDPPLGGDNCSLNGSTAQQIAGLPSGSIFPVGTTTNIFWLTDASGNTAQCSFSITIVAPPDLEILTIGNDFDGAGTGLILTSVTGGQPPYIFSWTKDGQPFPGTTQNLLNLFAGDYQMQVIDANGCATLFDVITVPLVVATGEPFAGQSVLLLPNPANDFIQLKTNGLSPLEGLLFDAAGRQIQTFSAAEMAGKLAVGDLVSGVYFLKIQLENGRSEMRRFLKTD